MFADPICIEAFIHMTQSVFSLVNILFTVEDGQEQYCEIYTESTTRISADIELCTDDHTGFVSDILVTSETTYNVSILKFMVWSSGRNSVISLTDSLDMAVAIPLV